MGITTFSGPVRSDNGFQEWNGSEWVPVAGGGGGGSVIAASNDGSDYFVTIDFADFLTPVTVYKPFGGGSFTITFTASGALAEAVTSTPVIALEGTLYTAGNLVGGTYLNVSGNSIAVTGSSAGPMMYAQFMATKVSNGSLFINVAGAGYLGNPS